MYGDVQASEMRVRVRRQVNVTSPGNMVKLQGPRVWELCGWLLPRIRAEAEAARGGVGNRVQQAQPLVWVATGGRAALNPVWRADGCASDDRALCSSLLLSALLLADLLTA